MPGFSLSFDPQSLSEMAQFAGFSVYLSEEVQSALQQAGSILVESAQANMHWVNPTGALEASITADASTPYEVIVGSDLPYARRREFGFTDMVDSLGRFFPYDPGAFYMLGAAEQDSQGVLVLIENAVYAALNRLGAS